MVQHDELADQLDDISPFPPSPGTEDFHRIQTPAMRPIDGPTNPAKAVTIVILAFVSLFSGFLGWILHRPRIEISPSQTLASSNSEANLGAQETNSTYNILVDVQGDVVHPGVVKVAETARIQDAIQKAGGFRHSGDASLVNAAAQLEDGEEIVVPSIVNASLEDSSADASPASGPVSSASPSSGSVQMLDLNTAGEVALDTLPGIGPSRARDIISYREAHGPFPSVDALQQVRGIGPTIFHEISPYVYVEGEKP